MALIDVFPPSWSSGEILSAAKLNQLSDVVNGIKGAAMAPTGVFVRSGNDTIWYMRRFGRYLAVDFTTSGTSCTTRILVNGQTEYNSGTLYPSGTTQTFDLDAVTDPPAVGEFYAVEVRYTAVSATHETTDIRETPAAAGGFVSPTAFASANTAATFLTRLQALSTACTALASVARTPSATWLRATDSTTYSLRRKQQYLYVNYVVTGSGSQIRILVNGTTVSNDSTEYPNGVTKTIDLSTVSGGPVVGANYSLEIRRTGGTLLMQYFVEGPAPSTNTAPAWAEGYQVTTGSVATFNRFKTVLDESYAILGDVWWQRPAIYRPYDHPRWAFNKSKRYLHYMRNGGLPATLSDPAGVQPDISLSRTTDDALFASYDLDSIDWLAPGGLVLAYECDVVWLDDEP